MEERILTVVDEALRTYSCRFTMDDIARRLHMSKATLYQKASSKEALIGALVDDRMARFNKAQKDIMSGAGSVEEKLLDYVELFVGCFWELPDRVYVDLGSHYPALWDRWVDFRESKFAVLMDILEEGVEKGALRGVNLTVLRIILTSACRGLNDPDFLKEENLTGSDVMNALEDIILHGIEK